MSNRIDGVCLQLGGLFNIMGVAYMFGTIKNMGGPVEGAKGKSGTSGTFETHPDFTPTKPKPEIIHEPIPEPSMSEKLGQWWDETLGEAQMWLLEKAFEYADTIESIIEFFTW